MQAFIQRAWGYTVTALGTIAAVVMVYLQGRSAGRADERQDRAEQIDKQAAQARQEVRNVQDDVALKDDDAVADRLKSDWLRGPGPRGR
jgi:predicted aconitase